MSLYPEIFEKTRFKEEDVKNSLKETAYLNPKLTIIYEDKRGDATEHIEYHATAPSTIRSRAEMMASACWRRNITLAISDA